MAVNVGIPFVAEGAVARGQAVMHGTAYPQVKLATGVNVQVVGYACADAIDGQEIAIHPVIGSGSVCKAIAGSTITRGASLQSSTVTGALKIISASSTLKYGCGLALEAATTGQMFDIMPNYFESAVTT